MYEPDGKEEPGFQAFRLLCFYAAIGAGGEMSKSPNSLPVALAVRWLKQQLFYESSS